MKEKSKAKVISQVQLTPGIYDLRLETGLAKHAGAGQFVGVYPQDKSTLLPRPISICESDGESTLRLVYRVAGKGTAEFSQAKSGDELFILGVLGNGYDLSRLEGKKVLLLGGGIGIPPMLELAKELALKTSGTDVTIAVGYRDSQTFLKEDLERYGKVIIASEDGSVGTKGNVMDAIKAEGIEADVMCACGPMPMLRAIKAYAEGKNIPAT